MLALPNKMVLRMAVLPISVLTLHSGLLSQDGVSATHFLRSDVDANGVVNLNDAVLMLGQLFRGVEVTCQDASDANDDGALDLSDPIFLLGFLFLGAAMPGSPYPECGKDPTIDRLTCTDFEGCRPGQNLVSASGISLVYIPPGSFEMGSPPDERGRGFSHTGKPGRGPDETQHRVNLSCAFYMSATEITQLQYKNVMGVNPSSIKSRVGENPQRAVNNVSWFDAEEYCKKLTQIENLKARGLEYRLPTEAEWEYACRAGTTTRFWFGEALDCRDDLEFTADCPELRERYLVNEGRNPYFVGVDEPNPWGLYGMAGNLGEWCLDWYAPYPQFEVTDPAGPETGDKRILRGDSTYSVGYGRSAARCALWPSFGLAQNVGFRIVLAECERPVPVTP